jgi:hypothetical protein
VSRFWDKVLGIDELRFGLVRKLLAMIVIVVGVLTFVLPLVSTNPPVMDKPDWSPLEIVSYDYRAELVRSSSDLFNFPVEIAVAYLLMPVAFYVVMIARSQRRLVHLAVIGIGLIVYGWSRAAETFDVALYRNFPVTEAPTGRHVSLTELLVALVLVMGALLFLSASEFLDGDSRSQKARFTKISHAAGDPEFIQAEVVSQGEEGKPRPEPLHLPE